MQAWLLDSQTGIDSLRLASVDDPTPGDNEVILRVERAALNPADRYLAEGQYPARPKFPHILGRDGVGTIVSTGANAGDWKPGDRALILRSEIGVNRPGTLAEFVAVPVESLAPFPQGWTSEQAAAAPLVYLTAHQAIHQWDGEIPKTSGVVLISGASGGVGVASVQLASATGHTVVALSRDAGKRDTLRSIGATLAFDPADAGWHNQLKQKLGEGRKVDLFIDNVGGEGFNDAIITLGFNGRVSVVGRLAGPVPQFNTATLFFRRIKIGGVAVGTYTAVEAQTAWCRIVETLDRSSARPLIDSVHGFRDTLAAFEALSHGPMGKVIVRVSYGI